MRKRKLIFFRLSKVVSRKSEVGRPKSGDRRGACHMDCLPKGHTATDFANYAN